MSKIFSKVPVQIPNKSGFDLSHKNLFTAPVGTLVPVLCHEVLPNDTVSLGVQSEVQLPPLAADFYGRVDFKYEAFFVPNRILWGGWQDFITSDPVGDASTVTNIPKFNNFSLGNGFVGPGSLMDYLGCKVIPNTSGPTTSISINNPLKFVAYHKIWEDYYRDSRIQRGCFSRSATSGSAGHLPFARQTGVTTLTAALADSKNLFDLRQRNWARDYFTNATPNPQAGSNPSEVSFNVSGTVSGTTATGSGSFTIASLRAANALQLWLERNNIAGYRYGDQMKAQFGIYPADAATQRAIYLGSYTQNVYKKGVYQTSNQSSLTTNNNNPFYSVGAKFGDAVSFGDGSLIDKFTASEHGFIFVMGSLVPHATYSTGRSKDLQRNTVGDFAFPLLAGVGDQVIKSGELINDANFSSLDFGYTQRYSEYKFMLDEVHGLLRDDVTLNSLSSFALQRSFTSNSIPSLGSAFLEIPKTYLDQVSAVSSTKVSNYGCWVDCNFVFKKSSTLPAYSIPTLSEPKDTHTEVIPNGGTRL